jgi:hypothetical protein
MKSALRWLGTLIVAVSIGTTVTLVVLLAMLWWKGVLADERVLAMLAALQGIKAAPPIETTNVVNTDAEQPSPSQIREARLRASLDLDLRESAIDKSLADLRTLEKALQTESSRLDGWKKSFDKRLSDLQSAATDTALLEVQRTLEAIQPKQAKEQILLMLKEPATTSDDPMQDIVTIFKAMPLDKRRKILAEFKTTEEVEQLADILQQIRLGEPDAGLLRDARGQLQQPSGSQR